MTTTDSSNNRNRAPAAQDAFALLNEAMQRWVWRQGWKSLNPLQQASVVPLLARDKDVILSAPTAAGKTEAVFLPIITDLLNHREEFRAGFGVLVVSPLKSLINDQLRRLEEMTEGIGVSVYAWHGDMAQSMKRRAEQSPEGILMITPESLEAMLTLRPESARRMFGALRYIVIDELHSFMGSERGIQLQSLLERLAKPDVPRVALSATIADRDEAKRFVGAGHELPVVIPEAHVETPPVRIALKEYVASDKLKTEETVSADIFARLRGRNNLVFTNSRKDAEAYKVSLSRLCEENSLPDEFRIHHGSLSRADRLAVEEDLRSGNRPATAICTASMELGVDIGSVSSIAQIGVAQSPSSLRQRLGRSGRRGESPVLRIYSVDERRDDYKFHLRSNLVQNIAVTELLREGRYDAQPDRDAFISIAVQQLIGLLGQHGSLHAGQAYGLLARQGPFGMLSTTDFAELLRYLGGKRVISQTASGLLVIGDVGERMIAKRDFFSAFTSAPDYEIIDNATGRSIGNVQYKPYYGEVFILGGEIWIVDSVEEKSSTVYVGKTVAKGKMMFEGTGPDVSSAVTLKMREVLMSTEEYPYLDVGTEAPAQLGEARRWFRKAALDSTNWYMADDTPVYFTWQGMNANRTLALMANVELGLSVQYDHLAIRGLSPENLAKLKQRLPDGDHPDSLQSPETKEYLAWLASHVNRAKKERGKFDPYLPDLLLDREYAARRLLPPRL